MTLIEGLARMHNADYDLSEILYHYLNYRRNGQLDKRFYQFKGTVLDQEDGEILYLYTSRFYRVLDELLAGNLDRIKSICLSRDQRTLLVDLVPGRGLSTRSRQSR